MQIGEQVWPCLSDTANLGDSAEPLVGSAKTIENFGLNSSCEAEKQITVQKKN